jgi:hypothetical protein
MSRVDAETVLVTRVGAAEGSRAAAAALACAASCAERAALLVELDDGGAPRPALIASAAARRLEERLSVHLPGCGSAARGAICQLRLPAGPEGLELAPAAVDVGRGAPTVLRLPPAMLHPVLEERRFRPGSALLRADLPADRALTALAVRELLERGLRVAVLKRPLSWAAARRALFGALPADAPGALPERTLRRLLPVAEGARG